MVTGTLRAAALFLVLLCPAADALAANYYYYAPLPAQLGDRQAEIYTPYVFQAHDGLAGPALVDAALKELAKVMPAELKAVEVKVKGGVADLKVDARSLSDDAVVDRGVGAIYHTLRAAGVKTVNLHGRAIDETRFSRGANLPVLTLVAALPPMRVDYGYVRFGTQVTWADDFYRRLAAGDQAVNEAALAQLDSGSAAVKLTLLDRLTAFRFKDITSVVVKRLKDDDVRVRLKALAMLEGNKSPVTLKALADVVETDPSADAKIAAVKLLVAAGQSKYKRYLLLEKLKSDNAATIVDAVEGLMKANDPKFATAFSDLVRHSNPSVRQAGVKGLEHYKQYETMSELLAAGKLDREVAESMARTLADKADGSRQARGISWLLESGSAANAVHAAQVAGEKRVAGTTEALGKALMRSEPQVRAAAANALGALRDPAGLEPLARALRNAQTETEKAELTDQAIKIISVQPLSQVTQIAKSPDVTVRELAIKSLASKIKENPSKVKAELKERLKDSEAGIRRAAAYALARIDDPGVMGDLIALKDDADPGVREQVAFALTHGQHPKADALLIAFLDDRDNNVKRQAAIGIKTRKVGAAMPKLRNMIKYRDPAVRLAVWDAYVTMSKPADPNNFDMFASDGLYDDNPDIRIMAVRELAKYTTDARAASTIGGAVTDQDPNVKLVALEVLSESKDPNAVEQVIRGLFDRDKKIKLAALAALEKLGNPKALKALTEFIKQESDQELQKRAQEVLDKL